MYYSPYSHPIYFVDVQLTFVSQLMHSMTSNQWQRWFPFALLDLRILNASVFTMARKARVIGKSTRTKKRHSTGAESTDKEKRRRISGAESDKQRRLSAGSTSARTRSQVPELLPRDEGDSETEASGSNSESATEAASDDELSSEAEERAVQRQMKPKQVATKLDRRKQRDQLRIAARDAQDGNDKISGSEWSDVLRQATPSAQASPALPALSAGKFMHDIRNASKRG